MVSVKEESVLNTGKKDSAIEGEKEREREKELVSLPKSLILVE